MAPPPSSALAFDPTFDYYALLSISSSASESEIRRAYRKTSLQYHPDKVEPTPANLDKFHQLQLALALLTDPAEKAKYDQTRAAGLRRKAETEALDARRRKLKEDLETREKEAADGAGINGTGGMKRNWSEREMKIERIREENRKRMDQANERRRREWREEEEKAQAQKKKVEHERSEGQQNGHVESQSQDEQKPDTMRRSIKVQWVKQGEGLDIDAQALEDAFAVGAVEDVMVLKDRKKRRKLEADAEHTNGKSKGDKVVMGTAVMVLSSCEAAEKAIRQGPWNGIESVAWVANDGDKNGDPT